ncbi:hypothetical protein DQ04_01161060 [Trypanosoma grayi]|uniref:hypothetical protein n=1 Tax=Trypanosoma grayi TaxID=71804 RepID=UPI0004F47449|nr:hypothetical protein DQ04_01161060 [Trypanosoma grayi]KEG13188.1 hypothetical protein DQ04_01161060 [Trypanosoma grayi]
MTGCLLSDLVRLGSSQAPGKNVAGLPFDTKHADDVLTCLVSPFSEVALGKAPLKSCEHIIERASASHVFLSIIPHCRRPVQEHLTSLFSSVQQAAGAITTTSTTSSAANTEANSDTAITTITAAEMGRILIDVLNATHAITSEQLAPLLREIIAASPTLLRRTEANRNNTNIHNNNNNDTIANTARKRDRKPGAVIAARVLLDQVEVIQPAIASYAAEMVEHGVGEVTATKIAGDDDSEARRRGLREVGRVMECLVALVELHVDLVGQLVPILVPYLEHEHTDIRLILLRGFFMAFGAHETAVSAYRYAFAALVARFNDTKHMLRIEMVQLAAGIIRAAAQASISVAEERVRELLPHLQQRLVDPHALVRRAAVFAYGDIIAAEPSLVGSDRLERTLGLRVADKNLKVRQASVEQLCGMYQTLLYPWIPNVVMRCLNAEGGVALLESSFESMLPPPSKVMKPNTLLNNSGRSSLSGRRSERASMVLFDFEKESATRERTYVDGFAKMCGHLTPGSFSRLLTFAAKKAQLRLAILRLFELRTEVRSKDLKSPEGQEMINSIHRLLNFLQTMTHAERGEWDALFRAKDDKISKAFLNCCSDRQLRFATERESLIKVLKGRVDGPVLRFLQDSLLRQMMLPLETEHIDELLARLKDALGGVCGDKHAPIDAEVQSDVEGMLRALLVFGRTAPSFLPRCATSLVDFLELLCHSSNASIPLSWVLLLLHCITEWAGYAGRAAADNNNGEDGSIAAIATRKKGLLTTLGKLCTCSHESLFRDATPVTTGTVCKHAARSFMSLLSVTSLREPKALSQLVYTLRSRLQSETTPATPKAVGWLKALTALAKDSVAAPLVQDESLVSIAKEVLFAAVRDNEESQDSARVKAKTTEPLHLSLASTIVEAAAKFVAAVALSYTTDRAVGAVSLALNTLLGAYKAVSERDAHTVGACHRRRAINQQLCKLVIKPSSDIGKELAVAVILSAEDEAVVRRPLQQKMALHLTQHPCDMRYAALLLLTVIGEETKNGYQHLRTLVQQVGDYLRSKQVASGATLSSPSALGCFLEYTIPFLVLFMAHHTFYSSEQENHFVAYQRVWHLLFDELFRHGTQCASFVVELLSRIKQADDVLDGDSHAARVVCDLGSRVMQECLGQRQISADALKRYPGRVLLPNFFVASKSAAEALSTVYLDENVHIFTHVPFRPPTAVVSGVGDRAVSAARSVAAGDTDPGEDAAARLPPLVQQRVDATLDALLGALTQQEIAKMRWSVVKERVKEAMVSVSGGDDDPKGEDEGRGEEEEDEGNVDEADLMEYAKGQLQLRYERAPSQ